MNSRATKAQTVVVNVPRPKSNTAKRTNKRKSTNRRKNNGGNQTQLASIPVARTTVIHTTGARFGYSRNGSIRVSHEELVQTVLGSDDFTVETIPINPGLSAMFPWLSSIASNYESYKFHKLHFKYIAASGSAQTGTVYIGAEFDPSDPAPDDEGQLASYQGTASTAPWKNVSYICTSQNLAKRKTYAVRNGIESGDLGLYDVGYAIIGTVDNLPSPPKLGKLWVCYEVELMTPQTSRPGLGSALSARFTGTDKAVAIPARAGNAPVVAFTVDNTLVFTALSPYQALVSLNLGGTGLSTGSLGGTATSDAEAVSVNAAATSVVSAYTVNMKRGQTVIFDFSTFTTVTGYFIRFGQYNFSNG